ncbi:hypothetical protein [Sulfurimonas sp.]|uniref:hypothetical protein n=1 Tax=Sulfurimonas sp. TaxID=2022749 RepID=UPI003569060E
MIISDRKYVQYNTELIPESYEVKKPSVIKKAYSLDIRSEALEKYYGHLKQNPYNVPTLSHWDVDNMIQVQGRRFNINPYSKYLKE